MKAPFPYFGGKSQVASLVWSGLGDVKHYIEPFFGSGAVLLSRPNYQPQAHTETVNDADGFVANVWRALQFSPDETARWCDWPVNHADLSARKRKLIQNESRLLENLIADDEWHDPKLAGYWIWSASCWIGSGLTRIGQIPHLSDAGMGVHAIGQAPHIGHTGKGVHAIGQRPHLGNAGKGVTEPYNTNIYAWFRQLSERLRRVRVVCGDWSRVCGGDWQDKMGTVGIFFDPPYGSEKRNADLYHRESLTVAADVRQWAIERGTRESYRIIIAGYLDEHQDLENEGWRRCQWSAQSGYSSIGKNENDNRHQECLWFSPHCIGNKMPEQTDIFGVAHDLR